ncbi:MAG: hypothetical protein IPG67_14700 [Acidobacteria bacterium]|nr:hypothetical protein [Acidobacteriota bacterium]
MVTTAIVRCFELRPDCQARHPPEPFRSINYVLNNDNSPPDNYTSSNGSIFRTGEVMPFVDQTMDFTVTARDGAGGVALDTTSVYITNTGPSFKVLVPDGGEVWNSGADHIIQWRVSGTDAPPISNACKHTPLG